MAHVANGVASVTAFRPWSLPAVRFRGALKKTQRDTCSPALGPGFLRFLAIACNMSRCRAANSLKMPKSIDWLPAPPAGRGRALVSKTHSLQTASPEALTLSWPCFQDIPSKRRPQKPSKDLKRPVKTGASKRRSRPRSSVLPSRGFPPQGSLASVASLAQEKTRLQKA